MVSVCLLTPSRITAFDTNRIVSTPTEICKNVFSSINVSCIMPITCFIHIHSRSYRAPGLDSPEPRIPHPKRATDNSTLS